MAAVASLTPSSLALVPGGEGTVEVKVRNTGNVVDQFTVEVLGDASGWATVDPPSVSLFPGTDGTLRVTFRPPRAAGTPSGSVAFAVRVASKEDPAGSVVEEGTLEVAPFSEVTAELLPRTTHGSGRGVHELAVDNRGNARLNATIEAIEPDELLRFAVDPPSLVAEPNTAAFAKVRVRAKKRFWRGVPLTRPFHVAVMVEGQPPVMVPGGFLQEPVLPRWFGRAVVMAIAGLLALVLLWFVLLRPTVRSAAKDAVRQEVTPPTIGAGGGGSAGGGGGGGSSGGSSSGGTTSGGTTAATGPGTPIDGRLFLTAKGSTSFEVPANSTLQLTDIVLQNPNGDTGPLQIKRDDNALLVLDLSNFRDLDYHFVAPIVFSAGQKLVLSADCTSPGCSPGAYFAGFIVKS